MNAIATITPDALIGEKFKPLSEKLAELSDLNEKEVFDYESKEGNKAARSHVAKLRVLKADIERARKEAKADALEYGRKVDGAAAEYREQVETMIEVHASPLREIKEREERKKENLHLCGKIEVSRHLDTGALISLYNQIDAMDPEGDEAVIEAKEKALEETKKAMKAAQKREAEAYELERLRAEKLRRQQEEQREAEERARMEEIEKAAKLRAAQEAEAARLREELAKKEAEEAKRQAAEAEKRAAELRAEIEEERAKVQAELKAERERKAAEEADKRTEAQFQQTLAEQEDELREWKRREEMILPQSDTIKVVNIPASYIEEAAEVLLDIFEQYRTGPNVEQALKHPKVIRIKEIAEKLSSIASQAKEALDKLQ